MIANGTNGAKLPMPKPPPMDPGNALIAPGPAQISTTIITAPAGQLLALTIRTPTTTLTVLLNGQDAKTWAANLTAAATRMSATGLITATRPITKP
jgi:hypothetical protein